MTTPEVIKKVLLMVEQPVTAAFYRFVNTHPYERRQDVNYCDNKMFKMTDKEVRAAFYTMPGDEIFQAFCPFIDDQGRVVNNALYNAFYNAAYMTDAQMRAYEDRKVWVDLFDTIEDFKRSGLLSLDCVPDDFVAAACQAIAIHDSERGEVHGRIAEVEQ